MVIGVEEGQGLLLEDEEDGIDEFEVFGQVIHLGSVRGYRQGPRGHIRSKE
jgi:hypothetical protein